MWLQKRRKKMIDQRNDRKKMFCKKTTNKNRKKMS